MTYPISDNETARVDALRELELIGTSDEPEFDAIVDLACAMFKVPIALVSLIDDDQQWFKALRGIEFRSTERESAFCNYPIASGELLVVNDAASDPRFSDNRLVTGGPMIRFYAGVPLALDPGLNLGTLCIVDTQPRAITDEETRQLTGLAGLVTALMRQHRSAGKLARMTSDLVRSKSLFERASELTKMGAWEWVAGQDQYTWTDGMYDIHEMVRGTPITPETVHALYPEDARREVQKLLNAGSSDGGRYTFEGPMMTAKGGRRWIRLMGDVEYDQGKIVRRFGVKQDITDQKATWDRLRFLAECDPLTGLSNRSVFEKRLRQAETRNVESPERIALLLIDLDGFKHLNDTFGHAVGDACLKQIARRLRRVRRSLEMVARLGGDEFALLLNITDDPASADVCAEMVLTELRRPVRWEGQSFQLSGSIGVAIATNPDQATQLFTQADLALYVAKASGRNTFRVFDPAMKARAEARYNTVRSISKALNDNQLELFYQPKMDLSKDTLSGFEALLRWRRTDGQVISAGEFMPALDDPELSNRIGDWVIEEALSQGRVWCRDGHAFGHIAINLSSGQFRDPSFGDRFLKQIADHGLQPEMIEVEVTEGVFLSQETGTVKQILETMQAAGIRIALDDFGTGYASLTHLRTYPVDLIKIDRSFVQHFMTSYQDHAILQSTLFLARHLSIDVVAEGIEETEQCEFLKALGCRFGQGYLFSKAVCADDAVKWCPPSTFQKTAVA